MSSATRVAVRATSHRDPAPPPRPAQRRTPLRVRARQSGTLWWVLPAVALSFLFVLYPVLETFRLSVYEWPGLGPLTFVGLGNFTDLLVNPEFWHSLKNNMLFAVLLTGGTIGLGLLFALAIAGRVRFWRTYQFIIFLPHILPVTVVAILWTNSLDPNYGWLTQLLRPVNPEWSDLLGNPSTAMLVICLVSIWQHAGFPMVMFAGALSSLPAEVIEAGRLDGANAVQMATRIQLPLIRDVIATVVLLQLIFSFKVFDIVQAMTAGGPGSATQVLGTLIYRSAYTDGDFGMASATAVLASLIITVISFIYLFFLRPAKMERNG
ncbi:carbohydrate ABC transporter permease [Agromyces sp. NPDC058104]|uniref:carbohydrate ABC transporter permease n=1 Tax=Agromyces sp. NPDC058104 TaxID=3346342 RepID=UPI0036DF71B8